MKRIFILLNIAFGLLIISCKKNTDTVATAPMSMYFEGKSWIANNYNATHNSDSIVIHGYAEDGDLLIIALHNPSGTGKYAIDSTDSMGYFKFYDLLGYDYSTLNGGDGVINITTLNATKVEGNYNFRGLNRFRQSKIYTLGKFSLVWR